MAAATSALDVWMNGEHVGVWHASRSGVPTFRYDPQWVRSPAARALSLSLPLTAGHSEHRGDVVAHYFGNLLPDSEDIRRRLGARFKTRSTGAFDLLTAIGRDCVGAVQLLPEGSEPHDWQRIEAEPLDEGQVEALLESVTAEAPLGQREGDDDAFRISIAGAQEKTALLRIGGVWHRPHGATPTTHILKLPLGLVGNMRADMTGSVENEWLCAQLLREFGLRVAHTEMATFGSQKALVVERFDRRWLGVERGAQEQPGFRPPGHTWIARLPQEDMCQALGVPFHSKYESDGGPGMQACLDVLAGGNEPDADRAHFALSQLAFWLLAATDGHAKNFSVFHLRGGGFSLTPLYDVLSAWPIVGEGANQVSEHRARLAMAVRSKNTHDKLREIRTRHWVDLAERCGVSGLRDRMLQMVEVADAALERVQEQLPRDFPPALWAAVRGGVQRHAQQFLREVASEPAP